MALVHTPHVDQNQICPDFNLLGVDGNRHSLGELQKINKPFLVMFICNHCPYVKAIEDRLIELGHDLKKLDIPVIAICANDEQSYPEDNFENLKKRWKEKNYPFLYLHDKNQAVAKSFGAVCTPDFFAYNKEMKLSYRGRLDDSWKDPSKVTQRELYNAMLLLNEGQALTENQNSSMGCSIKWLKDSK